MLKTRAMFPHKDQAMSLSLDQQSDLLVGLNNTRPITNPLALSLLIGLNNNKKCISDSDFVRSPKSPLEFRILCTMADSFFLRSPRSSLTAHLNCCCGPAAKVGLSIVDSLGDDRCLLPDVVFGPALRIKCSEIREKHPKLFPLAKSMKIEKERSGVVFEIGDNSSEDEPIGLRNRSFSANDCLRKTRVLSRSKLGAEGDFQGSGSENAFSSCLSEDDMEDYTCIIAHGPNPKTTHIYGDRVLECHTNEFKGDDDNKEKTIETEFDNFLSICNFCNKKLGGDDDIYMYRCVLFSNTIYQI